DSSASDPGRACRRSEPGVGVMAIRSGWRNSARSSTVSNRGRSSSWPVAEQRSPAPQTQTRTIRRSRSPTRRSGGPARPAIRANACVHELSCAPSGLPELPRGLAVARLADALRSRVRAPFARLGHVHGEDRAGGRFVAVLRVLLAQQRERAL